MHFKRSLDFDFGGAAKVNVDLSRVKMTDMQNAVLEKLFRRLEGVSTPCEEGKCVQDNCLASRYLEPEEFEQVRNLKARLGTEAAAAGIICDFCLDCFVLD